MLDRPYGAIDVGYNGDRHIGDGASAFGQQWIIDGINIWFYIQVRVTSR